jgi:putative NIF3 family GTP cyclohydrolase 1 type 2
VKAREIRDYLCSLDTGWVDWENTADVFLAGDPDREITGIAVAWMGYRWALERALDLGCDLFITHEPIYYSGRDDDPRMRAFPAARAKEDWLRDTGLTVLRCHDVWDQLPGIGIPDSWGRLLGFDSPIAGEGYYRVYDVSGRDALSIARQVAAAVEPLGQEAVELTGPADAPVSRLAIGTGAITPFTRFRELYNADIAVCTDDSFTYWREGALAADSEIPVVVVNHAVSEIYGMQCLAEHLCDRFPRVLVRYIPQRCTFRLVRA